MEKRLIGVIIFATVVSGCNSPTKPTFDNHSPKLVAPKLTKVDLKGDHLLGVATVASQDSNKVRSLLDKHRIPFAAFDDVDTVKFAVAEANVGRARKLIREDSWNHGYELLGHRDLTDHASQDSEALDGAFVGFDIAKANFKSAIACLKAIGIEPDKKSHEPIILVSSPDAFRAKEAIRFDAANHGYEYQVLSVTESEYQALGKVVQPNTGGKVAVAKVEKVPPSLPVKLNSQLVTVITVANKDVKASLAAVRAMGVNVPGTWESDGISGIVVPAADAPRALRAVQVDAKRRGYGLMSTTAREPLPPKMSEWTNPPATKDDLTAEANLIVFIREEFLNFVSDCLEARGISSGASCGHGSCGVYVSKLDADRALALVQEDSRLHGYTYSTHRIHYTK